MPVEFCHGIVGVLDAGRRHRDVEALAGERSAVAAPTRRTLR
jgi:hypothetical protein